MKKYKNFTKWLESKHLYHYWLENDKLGVEHRINPESKILQDNTFRFYIDSKGVGTYYPNSWFKENIGGLNIKFNLENETYNIGYEKIQLNPNDDSIDFFFHEYVGEVELKDFYKTLVDLLSKKIVKMADVLEKFIALDSLPPLDPGIPAAQAALDEAKADMGAEEMSESARYSLEHSLTSKDAADEFKTSYDAMVAAIQSL